MVGLHMGRVVAGIKEGTRFRANMFELVIELAFYSLNVIAFWGDPADSNRRFGNSLKVL
jgi:hypothetical protein